MNETEIIADCGILIGYSNKSIDTAHVYLTKFKTKKSRKSYIKNIVSTKSNSFFCTYDSNLLKLFDKNVEVYPLIPNASQYVRDMNNYGMVVMGIRRLLQLGFGLFSLMPTAVKNGFGVLSRDFKNIVVLLSDIEMVKLKKFKPRIVFLHPQMTDMFLANNNYEPIKSFANFINKKYKTEPGLFTNNVSLALEKLDEWNSKIKYVCTPVNLKGYMMKPDKEKAKKAIKNTNRTIIGYDVTCGSTIKLNEAIDYVRKLNVRKVVVSDFGFKP